MYYLYFIRREVLPAIYWIAEENGNMLFQALLSVAQYFCIATELLIAIL